MTRRSTLDALACVECKEVLREDGVPYCRNCLDRAAASILDASRPTITCDLRCKTVGLEVISGPYFTCCRGES